MFSFHARMIFNLIFEVILNHLVEKQKTPKFGVFKYLNRRFFLRNYFLASLLWASRTATVARFTISSTLERICKTCTGCFNPIRIGPIT